MLPVGASPRARMRGLACCRAVTWMFNCSSQFRSVLPPEGQGLGRGRITHGRVCAHCIRKAVPRCKHADQGLCVCAVPRQDIHIMSHELVTVTVSTIWS